MVPAGRKNIKARRIAAIDILTVICCTNFSVIFATPYYDAH